MKVLHGIHRHVSIIPAALLIICMLFCGSIAGASGFSDEFTELPDEISGPSAAYFTFPIYHFGIELITEGTNNYTLEREMRNVFPFDMDFTVFIVWGYTGDKINLKIADAGDTGDRLFAVALATTQSRSIPAWGTMYSSSSQNSFEISLPIFSPGAIVYLWSGFFVPSIGAEPYNYTITVSFPQ